MKKELRPIHDDVSCDVCGRTILKGERTEAYLAPGGQRYTVCELCTDRAYHEGWIRESAHEDMPVTRRSEPRRGLFGRLRWRREAEPGVAPPARAPEPYEEGPAYAYEDAATGWDEPEPYEEPLFEPEAAEPAAAE